MVNPKLMCPSLLLLLPSHRLQADGRTDAERRALQDAVNPKFVPRQHLLQYAVEGAEVGDSTELNALMQVRGSEAGGGGGGGGAALQYEIERPRGRGLDRAEGVTGQSSMAEK